MDEHDDDLASEVIEGAEIESDVFDVEDEEAPSEVEEPTKEATEDDAPATDDGEL
jgi:hypothetical protein